MGYPLTLDMFYRSYYMALLAFANSVYDLVSGRMIHTLLGDFDIDPLDENVGSRKLQNVPES